jgi:hypothetical protein
MKVCPKSPHLQFNLLLSDPAPAELPKDKNELLVQALVELLLNAANESLAANARRGVTDES